MTGSQNLETIKQVKGKIFAFVSTPDDGRYIPVEKAALMVWMNAAGDSETGMLIQKKEGRWFFSRDYDTM